MPAASPPKAASTRWSSGSAAGSGGARQNAPARPAAQHDEEIAGVEKQLRPVGDELVASRCSRIPARARQCEHVAAVSAPRPRP